MKKIAWLLALLLILIGADEPVRLVKFTAINKAEIPIAVQLIGQSKDYKFYYYLQVPEGSREDPEERTFTIGADYYFMRVFYVETYDPVYGFTCNQAAPNQLLAAHNIRVVFLPCDQLPPNAGEATMRKYTPYPFFSPLCLIYKQNPFLVKPPYCNHYFFDRFIY
jgi:hypothetical protein